MFYTIPWCNVLQRCASHLGCSIRTVAVLPKELAKNFGDRRLKAANLWHTQSKHGNFANFSYSLLILSSRIIFVLTWYCVSLKIKLSRKVMLYTTSEERRRAAWEMLGGSKWMRLHCRNIDSPIVSLALLQANASLKGCARLARRPRPFNRKTTKKYLQRA